MYLLLKDNRRVNSRMPGLTFFLTALSLANKIELISFQSLASRRVSDVN